MQVPCIDLTLLGMFSEAYVIVDIQMVLHVIKLRC